MDDPTSHHRRLRRCPSSGPSNSRCVILLRSWGYIIAAWIVVSTVVYVGFFSKLNHETENASLDVSFEIVLDDSHPRMVPTLKVRLFATEEPQLASNESQLESNESQLASHESQLASHESQLAPNESQPVSNESQLISQEYQLSSNKTLLLSNESRLISNETRRIPNESHLISKEYQLISMESELRSNKTQLIPNESRLILNETRPISNETQLRSLEPQRISKDSKLIAAKKTPIKPAKKPRRRRKPAKKHRIKALRRKHLPKCLIIGVQKGGTGALIEFLDLHPDIVVKHDEAHFFDMEERYEKGLTYYMRRMPRSTCNQITVEKTPAYFYVKEVPARVYQMNSSIRLILTVRNPVTRLISHYTMLRKQTEGEIASIQSVLFDEKGNINETFFGYDISTYHVHLSRWLKYFPRSQIHIVDGDNFIKDPLTELYKVEKFLGVSHSITKEKLYFDANKGFYCMVTAPNQSECLPETKGMKHPYLSERDLEKVRKYFEPLNEQFFKVANRTFDWN